MPAITEGHELVVATAHGPLLSATRCLRCAYVDFPPQTYGCRRCGAHGADLAPARIPTRGTVLACATVHRHPDPTVAVPFTVAVLDLDAGPVTRVVMRDTEPPTIGDVVRGELVDAGNGTPDLRFGRDDVR